MTSIARVLPLKTPSGLVIPLLQSSTTHNYNHSQLFPKLCYLCTAYKHLSVRDYNHLLHSYTQSLLVYSMRLHWLTSQLTVTITGYHTLSHTKVFNSRCEFTSCRTPLNNWLVGLLVTNCSRYISNWAYVAFSPIPRKPVTVALTVAEQRIIDTSPTVAGVSQWRDCLLRCLGDACDVTAACSSPPPAERGDTERTPLPLPWSAACIQSRVGWRTAA
jgi:hypothetical protein